MVQEVQLFYKVTG